MTAWVLRRSIHSNGPVARAGRKDRAAVGARWRLRARGFDDLVAAASVARGTERGIGEEARGYIAKRTKRKYQFDEWGKHSSKEMGTEVNASEGSVEQNKYWCLPPKWVNASIL